MPTGYNHHTIPMEKVLQAQTKPCLAKSRNQDEDPCPNLPELAFDLMEIPFLKCLVNIYRLIAKVLSDQNFFTESNLVN